MTPRLLGGCPRFFRFVRAAHVGQNDTEWLWRSGYSPDAALDRVEIHLFTICYDNSVGGMIEFHLCQPYGPGTFALA